jgi:hypothetical protein
MGAIVVGIVALTIWAEVDTCKQLPHRLCEGGRGIHCYHPAREDPGWR